MKLLVNLGFKYLFKMHAFLANGTDRREQSMDNKDKDLKLQVALLRCAKAAFLLSALKLHPTSSCDITINHPHEDMWRRENEDLKIKLAKERLKNQKIKLCSIVEFIVQIMLLLSLSSFFWMFVINAS